MTILISYYHLLRRVDNVTYLEARVKMISSHIPQDQGFASPVEKKTTNNSRGHKPHFPRYQGPRKGIGWWSYHFYCRDLLFSRDTDGAQMQDKWLNTDFKVCLYWKTF